MDLNIPLDYPAKKARNLYPKAYMALLTAESLLNTWGVGGYAKIVRFP